MVKNLGRKFATMDEDERRRFAMQSEGGTDSAPDELNLENPRTSDTLGPTPPDEGDEVSNPDAPERP
jgi:hypothetical protein